MIDRDPSTLDFSNATLRLADDIRVWPVHERGNLVYRIEIPSLHRFFRVGYSEYVLISLLDGNTTLPQALGLTAAKLGRQTPTTAQSQAIVQWLLQNELAVLADQPNPSRHAAKASPNATASRFGFGSLNPFWMKVPLCRSDRWVRILAPWTQGLFSFPSVILWLCLVVAGSFTLLVNWDRFTQDAVEIFSPLNGLALLLIGIGLKLIHELAHALACHRQGAATSEFGVVFVLFAPLAYVDVTTCWRINSRGSRIIVASAGMYVEIAIGALAAVMWGLTHSDLAAFLLHRLVLAATVSTVLFNANPLMRFDGYYILCDLVDIPNLYAESSLAVRRLLSRLAYGHASDGSGLTGWRRPLVLLYGLAALGWRLLICVSLMIAASAMFAGAGVALAAVGVYLWFAQPAKRFLTAAITLHQTDKPMFWRASIVGSTLLAIGIATVGFVPIPTATRAHAVAQYLPETVVRSRADGFIANVHVSNLQSVRAGDLMLELVNPEIRTELLQLELERQQVEIRLSQATDRKEENTRRALLEDRRVISQRLEQMQEKYDGLRLVAARSGRILSRDLRESVGTYVREGDELLVLARADEKEVVAMVGQTQMEQARPTIGSTLSVHLADRSKQPGFLDQVDPRATDRLIYPSLSATESGPLAVRGQSEDASENDLPVRLLEPHFTARVTLPKRSAESIPAGMRVQVDLEYCTDTLAMRLANQVRRLWYRVHETR
ncbi:efflux RND transporter periplasmic adaptor subunit [Novipirellula artificiosorum]|uniref:efflux RND transporter periplasmic adaptor subunit n=1 Tax=Novipirellula artificiosorum TaxID=2528016 RepID=UPI0018CCA176|nr:efflux RND transporter periplasmic adaptor subunit [Novipirellula artificiosorum]